jgi:thiol-disulfide isomerase/thioredoxin
MMKISKITAILAIFAVFFWSSFSRAESSNPVRRVSPEEMIRMLESPENTCMAIIMASWCTPCREEMPMLIKLNQKYKDQGLKMIGLSVDFAGPEAIQPMLDKFQVPFPVFWAGESPVEYYQIQGIPLIIFFKNGKIHDKILGKCPEEVLEKKISAFLGMPKSSQK